MASLIYIPTTDPFAIFGIILLFALVILFLLLLIHTARKSAQDARKAVHNQARYQRLLQLQRKEEQRSFRRMEEGRGKARAKAGPSIVVTAPSAFSSMRSTAVPQKHSSRPASTRGNMHPDADPLLGDQDTSTATTSLMRGTQSLNEYSRQIDRLPRALRVGPQHAKSHCQQEYQQIDGEEGEDVGRG